MLIAKELTAKLASMMNRNKLKCRIILNDLHNESQTFESFN